VTAKVNDVKCPVAWSGESFGRTSQQLAKQQNHNDDDEQEADRASANPDGIGKNWQ